MITEKKKYTFSVKESKDNKNVVHIEYITSDDPEEIWTFYVMDYRDTLQDFLNKIDTMYDVDNLFGEGIEGDNFQEQFLDYYHNNKEFNDVIKNLKRYDFTEN